MLRRLAVVLCLVAVPALLVGQQPGSLDPATILKPLAETWPTYSGDYTGRRYSALTQINQSNVKNLVAGVGRARVRRGLRADGPGLGGRRRRLRRRRRRRRGVPLIVGGEGTGEFNSGGPAAIRGSILMVDGVLYADVARQRLGGRRPRRHHPLAVLLEDARRHAHRPSRRRHVAQLSLHARRHDNYLVKLDARTGKERWHVEIAGFRPAVLLVDGADHRRQPRDRRHRQRSRHARIPAVVRSRNRQAAVDLLHRADESRRSGAGDVAEPRCGAPRRRSGVGAGRLRS